MKLVFMGTPAFAVPSLEALVAAGHQVLAVYSQPDRPKGRGQSQEMPAVKQAALKLSLPVYQPERIRHAQAIEQLRELSPEVIIAVAYGQIIPKAILDIPPLGIINVHASLLPRYRGAAPIQWAIANGETRTGITTMRINEGLDTGEMLMKCETEIGPEETAPELSARLAHDGAQLLLQTLAQLSEIVPEPQDNTLATYAPILKKEDGKLDWTLPPQTILNRIRGFEPWPGGYGFLREQRLQIWQAAVGSITGVAPGMLSAVGRKLYVGCGQLQSLELLEIQMQGKKRMPASAFLNGFSLLGGEQLQ